MQSQDYDNDATFITGDPGVYEHLHQKAHELISLSSLLTKEEIDEISSFSIVLTKSIIETVKLYFSKTLFGKIDIDVIMNKQVYNLIGTSFYRYGQLGKIKDMGVKVFIPYFEVDEPKDSLFPIRNNNLLIQLAMLPEFNEIFSTILLDRSKQSVKRTYDIIGGRKLKYWLYYVLALCSEPSLLAYSIQVPLIKRLQIIFQKKHNLHILISIDTPLIMVQLFRLFLSGAKISFLKEGKVPEHIYGSRKSNNELKELIIKEIKDNENKVGKSEYTNLISYLADKISIYVNSYVIPVTKYLDQRVQNEIDNQFANKDQLVLFTGTRNPNMVHAISSGVYANRGFPRISFGEGCYCLLKYYRAHVLFGYMHEGEAYVSYNPYEEYYFKKTTKKYLRPFYIIGAKKMLKGYSPKLSKMLGRKIWGIPQNKAAVLYLPTRYYGKSIRPYYEIPDVDYWKFQKNLVLNVLGRSGKDTYIKIFKKGLLSTQEQKMHPLNMINLPSNVTIKESPDFRYMRFSADLLIVDLATSTMCWALTSNVPVVYLNMEQSPLEDSVYEDMKKSLFLVDVKENNNWESELLELLQRPICEINKEWENMSSKRDKFVKYYLTGYERSRNDFYSWIKYISDMGVDSLRRRNMILSQVDNANTVYLDGQKYL